MVLALLATPAHATDIPGLVRGSTAIYDVDVTTCDSIFMDPAEVAELRKQDPDSTDEEWGHPVAVRCTLEVVGTLSGPAKTRLHLEIPIVNRPHVDVWPGQHYLLFVKRELTSEALDRGYETAAREPGTGIAVDNKRRPIAETAPPGAPNDDLLAPRAGLPGLTPPEPEESAEAFRRRADAAVAAYVEQQKAAGIPWDRFLEKVAERIACESCD
ncbi:MAG: hypothetical protein R3F61_00210 [Myxococcota bacterium]